MISPLQKQVLHAFVAGRLNGRDVVDFADELGACKKWLPALAPLLEGKHLSTAMRAAGFNRRYDAPGRKRKDIVYARAA